MTMKQVKASSSPLSLYVKRYFATPLVRKIAHGIKNGDMESIVTAAEAMKGMLPTGRPLILVPIPSRKGYPTTTLLLAEEIRNRSERADVKVIDALRGNARPSFYEEKRQGFFHADDSWFGFRLTKELPKDAEIFVVDNVESTGSTMRAAITACGRGKGLVYAYNEIHGRGKSKVTHNLSTTIMTQKNHQEQKAADMQVEMLIKALEKATKNDGVLLNADHRAAPTLFPRGKGTGGFNSLILGLHADESGYKTGVYTLFNEAKKADVSIRMHQHGIPVTFTRWDTYANIKNPQITVSKDEYKAMSQADQALYRPKPTRELRVLFNIDQTTMHSVKKDDYEALVNEKGCQKQPIDDKDNRIKINLLITNIRTNLVGVQRDSTGIAHYDAAKDKILLPAQNRFEHYEDYVQELLRQTVSATGHQQRLARQGVEIPNGKAPEQDKVSRERLIVELASAIKMQEMGMTAKLASESHALVPEWTKALKENPCYLDSIVVDVNSALDVIAKAEQGKKVEYASVRNEQQTAILAESIGQKGKVAIDNVQMVKDDDGRWAIFLKPDGQAGFSLYPERDDLNRFFTTLKNGSEEAIDNLRAELAQKYYVMATTNPQLKIDLFGKDTPQADLDRISRSTIFRSKDGKFLIMPTIDDKKQHPRELTQNQWQRMWLSEDMKTYKIVLAANVFKDVLHPELAQQQTKGEENGQTKDEPIIHQVPEWAVPYIVNGDATGLTDEEKNIIDEFLDRNFPDGFIPEVNQDNKNELNPNPAFGTRNENALTGRGESPFQAVNTIEMAFHPAGEMKVVSHQEEENNEAQKERVQKTEEQKAKEKESKEKEEKSKQSPILKQFFDLKQKHPEALLLFRIGDFYEAYMEDAEKASKILGITLTSRNDTRTSDGKPLHMAGFPYHALDSYLPKLIRAGERIAICDHIETSRQSQQKVIEEVASKEQSESQSHAFRR